MRRDLTVHVIAGIRPNVANYCTFNGRLPIIKLTLLLVS